MDGQIRLILLDGLITPVHYKGFFRLELLEINYNTDICL